jgi:hypothetical protein
MNNFPHLEVDTGDQRKWVATPGRKLSPWRAIPYRIVLSSATRTSGSAHDATFVFKHQPWGLDPLMDVARTKFNLRVDSFILKGVKNAQGDAIFAVALLVNLDGQGFDQRFTYDSSNRGMTSCVCTATGDQEAIAMADNWDVPVHTLPGTVLRVFLSEVATPRTPGAALLDALTTSYEWHAVLALTPCDEDKS